MNNLNKSLVLFLRFDEIIDFNKVKDTSSKKNDSTLQGNPQLNSDDTFGSCLKFDGKDDYVSISKIQEDFSNGFTLEAWIYYSSFKNWSSVIDFGNGAGNDNIILANVEASSKLTLHIYQGGINKTLSTDENILKTNQWMHLTATVDKSGQAILYLYGQKVKNASLHLPNSVERKNNYIGKSNWNANEYFDGKIASIRIYNHALSPEEIQWDMEEDQVALAAFRKTYPIGFSLHDDNDEAVLYISDGSGGQKLTLDITNTSQENLVLSEPTNKTPGSDNHHFELRFRPGTLSTDALSTDSSKRIVESGWDRAYQLHPDDRTVSLYFLKTDFSNLDIATIKPSQKISLNLQGISAAAEGGTRGTRVELRYRQLTYQDEKTPLSGSREQSLSIVNRQGKKNIPLHVGFVSSNNILNDGSSSNELILQITNVLKEDIIDLNPESKGDRASKFIISFDIQSDGETKDWALGTKSQVNQINIEGKDWRVGGAPEADWKIIPKFEGDLPIWILTHQNEHEPGLAPGQVIQLNIKNIISSLPSGYANLYLRYENIPGYWDGQFVVPIEKAPILYRDVYDKGVYQNKSNVGIGTREPRTALDTGTGVMSGAANDYQKAQFTMSGGGTVTWGGPGGRLKWTERFIAISMERSKSFSEGFINISQPALDLPAAHVYDGTSRSATSDGIVLHKWEAMYGIHTLGGDENAITFRIEKYTNNFYAPSNWLLVAVVNGDDGTVKLGTGVTLSKNSSSSKGSPIPCGTIFMWSGTNIPDGWALCDGRTVNGYTTPNLAGRFIAGYGNGEYAQAGNLSEKGTTGGNTGGTDKVSLTVDEMPSHQHSGKTAPVELYLERRLGGLIGSDNVYARAANDQGVISIDLSHQHNFQTKATGENQSHENRPPYYVLAYIMKV